MLTQEQICQNITSQSARGFTCRSPIYTAVSCTSCDRPYPLSVQWPYVRHFGSIPRLFPKTSHYAVGRSPLRGPSLFQAHLSLPCASLLRLSVESLLLEQKLYFPHPMAELCAIGHQYSHGVRSGFLSFCILGSDESVAFTPFSLLTRPMSRLLGTQCLGHVFFHRSRLTLW